MDLKNRMSGIDVNLDDLQSGVEACSRAASGLHGDAVRVEKILRSITNAPGLGTLVRHAADLKVLATDQRGALQELRDGIRRLQEELKASNGGIRPPPIRANAESRSR